MPNKNAAGGKINNLNMIQELKVELQTVTQIIHLQHGFTLAHFNLCTPFRAKFLVGTQPCISTSLLINLNVFYVVVYNNKIFFSFIIEIHYFK